MNLKTGIFISIGVVLLLIFAIFVFNPTTKVNLSDDKIVITQGANYISGTLEPAEDYTIIMKDFGKTVNTFSGDAFFISMRFDIVEDLSLKYGNIFLSSDPLAIDAVNEAMVPLVVIAENSEVKKSIEEALAIIRVNDIPKVVMTASKVNVEKQSFLFIPQKDYSANAVYYVTAFKILNKKYF